MTKYFVFLSCFLTFSGCVSQNLVKQDLKNLAYELISDHFNGDRFIKDKKYISHKTVSKDEAMFLKREFGVSVFLKDSKIYKCAIDSLLSNDKRLKLDSLYNDFKVVELNDKKIKTKNVVIAYSETQLANRSAVARISFPAIIYDNRTYYGVITYSNSMAGVVYFYIYKKGKWQLLCERLLYVS